MHGERERRRVKRKKNNKFEFFWLLFAMVWRFLSFYEGKLALDQEQIFLRF
jgi:hypothetical protein